MKLFIVLSKAGSNRNLAAGSRDQPWWDDHAAFIDGLVDSGFILLGGPLTDEGGAMIVVQADTEADVRTVMNDDPWYRNDVLQLERIARWEMFVDQRVVAPIA